MTGDLAVLAADTIQRTSTMEAVTFWVLGTLAVVGAVAVVAAPKAVYSAIFLAITMIVLAMLYIAQDALFDVERISRLTRQSGSLADTA